MKNETKKAIAALATETNVARYAETSEKFLFADEILIEAGLDARDSNGGSTDENDRRVALLEDYLEGGEIEALEVEVILTGRDGVERTLPIRITEVGQLTEYASAIVRDSINKGFRFGSMNGTYPGADRGDLTAFIRELNSISRFGTWTGTVSTR